MECYQLAVLEDDTLMREEICRMCGEILSEAGISHEITQFSKAEELEKKIRKRKRFHLLVLDIVLDGMSGMELAKKLRDEFQLDRNRLSILFLTGYESFWQDGFRTQAIQYLMKPVNREALKKVLTDDWKQNRKPRTVVFQKGNRMLQLPTESVFYIVSGANHNVEIHQEKQVDIFRLTLLEAEELLANAGFVRCHNSFLVNLKHVREFDKSHFLLEDGTEIPIGRKYYQSSQCAMIAYANQ